MSDKIKTREQIINTITTNSTYGRFRSREEIEQSLNETNSINFTPYNNVICTTIDDDTLTYDTNDINSTYDTFVWRGRAYSIKDLADYFLNKEENKPKEVTKWEEL